MTGAEETGRCSRYRRSQQRGRGDEPDLERAESELGQIGWQDDERETIADASRRACRIEIQDRLFCS